MTAAVTAQLSPMQDCAILQATLNSQIERSYASLQQPIFHGIAVPPASASYRFRFILHNRYRHLQRFSSTPFIRRAGTQRINAFSLGARMHKRNAVALLYVVCLFALPCFYFTGLIVGVAPFSVITALTGVWLFNPGSDGIGISLGLLSLVNVVV